MTVTVECASDQAMALSGLVKLKPRGCNDSSLQMELAFQSLTLSKAVYPPSCGWTMLKQLDDLWEKNEVLEGEDCLQVRFCNTNTLGLQPTGL